MKFPKLLFFFPVALLLNQLCLTPRALADTLVTYDLGSDNNINFYGMDDFGHVVLTKSGGGPYFTFLNGQNPVTSLTPPSIIADNGNPCTPSVPAGYTVVQGVCNNGRNAFIAFDAAHSVIPGLFYDANNPTFLGSGTGSFLFMDGLGDLVWNEPSTQEKWFETVNLSNTPVPEPASALLLITGLAGAAAMYRRRQTV